MNLSNFKNRHEGERCFIVCNGPSLNSMNLALLQNEIVFGLNKIYLGLIEFGFYPRYLVSVNEKVIKQSLSEFEKLTCVKFIGDRYKKNIKKSALMWRLKTESYKNDFSFDICEGLQEGNTVTYAAMQLAYYMGFQTVVIVGMDHKFEYSGGTNEAQLLKGPDCNHFTSDYFKDQEWDTPDLYRSELFYKTAKHVFESDGRAILDATFNGACNVFNKVDYMELFK